jgi:hypothetical protein
MGFNFVQVNNSQGSGSSSVALAYTSNNTLNNLLVAGVRFRASAQSFTSLTDSQGNTWLQIGSFVNNASGNNFSLGMFYVPQARAGANTVTLALSAVGNADLVILEYSGNSASPLDTSASSNNGGGGGTTISANITPSAAGNLLVGYSGNNSPGQNWTVSGSYVPRTSQTNVGSGAADILSAPAGSTSTTFTWINTGLELMVASFIPTATSSGRLGWVQGHRAFVNKRGYCRPR